VGRVVSLSALTVLELAPPDMVTCARDAGYTHVGLRLIPATPNEPSYETIGDTPVIRETLARLADTGITVLDIEILRLKPDVRVRDFLPVLETARDSARATHSWPATILTKRASRRTWRRYAMSQHLSASRRASSRCRGRMRGISRKARAS
jgi:hypothetical protein